MRSQISIVFVDPCLRFRRSGMTAKLFLLEKGGDELKVKKEISAFYDNHFRFDGLEAGNILCHQMKGAHSFSSSNAEEIRFLMIVHVSDQEIEFSQIFNNWEDFQAYLKNK
ncbi:MAG: hypothetical protein PHN19_04755 [Patescibacteria group bacterium]|nr:hypothetical protein [Patescibacteria group bacterium]